MTMYNMVFVYKARLKGFTKVEDIFRLALDGYEKSQGEDREDTKRCVMSMAALYCEKNDGVKMRALVARYPHLVQGDYPNAVYISSFIE